MGCNSVQILALSAPLEVPEAERKDLLAAYHRFLLSSVMPLCARTTRRLEDMHVSASGSAWCHPVLLLRGRAETAR